MLRRYKVQSETLTVTGYRGLNGCEASGISHFHDNRHTDGDEVKVIIYFFTGEVYECRHLRLFLGSLFNDAVISSVYITFDDGMNNELERPWKEAVVAIFSASSGHLLDGLIKTAHANFSNDSRPLSQGPNLRPSE
jgi:hypothetical protein